MRGMRNERFLDQSGSAFVVTLAVISILVAAAVQLGVITGKSVLYTMRYKDEILAKQKALSGIALGRMILADDAAGTDIDSVQESWADRELLKQAIQAMGYDPDTVSLHISDEMGKIQVNALMKAYPGRESSPEHQALVERFFSLKMEHDETFLNCDARVIVNSLTDWLDSRDNDAVTGISGAEDDHYKSLERPYACANEPFNTIRSLLLVNGLNMPGLENFDFGSVFTVFGITEKKKENKKVRYGGKINVNTAGADVLAALLPEGLESMAEDLVTYRSQKSENGEVYTNMLDKGWVEKVVDLSDEGRARLNRLAAYSSNTFKIVCTARENDTEVSLAAYVEREKDTASGRWSSNLVRMEQCL